MQKRHIADPEPDLGPLFERRTAGSWPPLKVAWFEGPQDGDPTERTERLGRQLADVFEAIQDGQAYTLEELSRLTGHPQASVSAQLRHLSKPRFGGFIVEKQHKGHGLYVYRLVLREDGTPARAGSSRA